MDVLSVVHGEDARTELFGAVVAAAGHRLSEWSFASGGAPPRGRRRHRVRRRGASRPGRPAPVDEGRARVARGLDRARRADARDLPRLAAARPRGGLVGRAARDARGRLGRGRAHRGRRRRSGLSALPRRFAALEWHHYHHGLPEGAVELARNSACLQAFRLGDACWGVQFHPEVTGRSSSGGSTTGRRARRIRERFRAETRRARSASGTSSGGGSAVRSSSPQSSRPACADEDLRTRRRASRPA